MLSSILLQTTPAATTMIDTAHKIASQVPAGGIPVPGVKPEDSLSLMELIMKGGYIMIPIGVLLFFAVYVLFERIIVLSRASRFDRNFMNTIKDFIVSGNIEAAKSLCRSNTSPQAVVIGKGLSRLGKPVSEIKDAMESAGKSELYKIERNMIVLNIIGRIAPMFGFVGTIIGVVKIFYDISLAGGDIKIDTISAGLYQKMITSASGLIVGIVAFASYHILNIIIEKIINRMENSAMQFMDILNEPSK